MPVAGGCEESGKEDHAVETNVVVHAIRRFMIEKEVRRHSELKMRHTHHGFVCKESEQRNMKRKYGDARGKGRMSKGRYQRVHLPNKKSVLPIKHPSNSNTHHIS